MVPLVGNCLILRVRSVQEDIVLRISFAALYLGDLLAYLKHNIAEAIQLGQRLRLGRFNHERTVYGEGERRRMVAVVHESLGDIGLGDTDLVELAAVEYQLVPYPSLLAGIDDAVCIAQTSRQIVGRENSSCCSVTQAFGTHHCDVTVGDECHIGVAIERRADAVVILRRQAVGQSRGATNGTYARSTTAVRRCKGLMQIQVANIGSDKGRTGVAYLGIHIGAVHIDESTVLMDGLAHTADRHLKNTVGRRIRDHAAGQVVLMLLGLGAPVLDIRITVLITTYHNGNEACLCTRGRVGAMGRSRDEQHVTMGGIVTTVILTYRHQAGIFAGCTGCRLQVAGIKSGDGAQLLLQFAQEAAIAGRLIGRCKRMNTGESLHGDRYHRGSGIKLHSARPQRYHGVREGYILAVETLDVTHHFGLGMVALEYLGLHIVHLAYTALVDRPATGKGLFRLLGLRHRAGQFGKERDQVVHIIYRDGLVNREAYVAGFVVIEIESPALGRLTQLTDLFLVHQDTQGVEELGILLAEAIGLEHFVEISGFVVDTLGYLANAFRSVIYTVEAGHHRRKGLGSTDITGGFLALDMLFTRLQGQAVGRTLVGILAQTDNTSW